MPYVDGVAKREIRGLKEFRRELRRVDKSLLNEMRKVHRKVSDLVVLRTKAAMAAGGPQAAKAAAAVKARATSGSAIVDTVAKPPFALGVLWGQRKRTGWYAAPRYADSGARQFDDWVGNQWDPGEHGGQPYFLGDAVNGSLDEIDAIYLEGIDDLARRAFPD